MSSSLFRALFCIIFGGAVLGVALPGCDTPLGPPEPTIEIDKKVEALNDEVAKTRAEAKKRHNAASKTAGLEDDAGRPPEADAGSD